MTYILHERADNRSWTLYDMPMAYSVVSMARRSNERNPMTSAQQMHQAMVDLQTRKITPDQFRSVMRTLRAQSTPEQHDRAKGTATALHTHNPNAR
jgi:hypothetical protein